MTARIHIASKH